MSDRARRPHPGDAFWEALRSKSGYLVVLTLINFLKLSSISYLHDIEDYNPAIVSIGQARTLVFLSCWLFPLALLLLSCAIVIIPRKAPSLLLRFIVIATPATLFDLFLAICLTSSTRLVLLSLGTKALIIGLASSALQDAAHLVRAQVAWETTSREIDARRTKLQGTCTCNGAHGMDSSTSGLSSVEKEKLLLDCPLHSYHTYQSGPQTIDASTSSSIASSLSPSLSSPPIAPSSTPSSPSHPSSFYSSLKGLMMGCEGPLSVSGMPRLETLSPDDPFILVISALITTVPVIGDQLHKSMATLLTIRDA